MIDIATTLRECHRIVWEARKELEPYWPTPPVEDCLLFAFCELGESIDAYLRTKPEYARNNAKELDVLDELADCALMLLTAFRGGVEPWESGVGGWDLMTLGYFMGDMLGHYARHAQLKEGAPLFSVRLMASTVLTGIVTYPGMDLPARLTARLERIKAKRIPQAVQP